MHQPCDVADIQSKLYEKYSSSQTYFYTKKISDIVKEKRTNYNIVYEDIQCYTDDDQFLKRFYKDEEHPQKMNAFKQYYFYHEDCPRIFIKNIEIVYEKWQDKKRDMVYKKLKLMYNESYSSNQSSDTSNEEDLPPISNFLLNVSQFNPYSKKYYLRVQARKQKEELQRKKQAQKMKTKFELSGLNHNLSLMLADMSNISTISNINKTQEKQTIEKIKSKSKEFVPSNPKSTLKLNFKKNKEVPVHESKGVKNIKLFQKKGNQIPQNKLNLSPKMGKQKLNDLNSLKAKSIFTISSFNSQPPQVDRKGFDLNIRLTNNSVQKRNSKDYQSQKIIKIKDFPSNSKSTGKLPFKNEILQMKGRQNSLKELHNVDAFSDKKIQLTTQTKLKTGSTFWTKKTTDFKIREKSKKK